MTYEWYTTTTDNSRGTWTLPTAGNVTKYGGWSHPYYWEDRWKPSQPQSPVIVRYPKKPKLKWKPFIKKNKRIPNIGISDVRIEIRPVMVCGWCGARIRRGDEEKVCPYCGS
jgi:hypothetical protein